MSTAVRAGTGRLADGDDGQSYAMRLEAPTPQTRAALGTTRGSMPLCRLLGAQAPSEVLTATTGSPTPRGLRRPRPDAAAPGTTSPKLRSHSGMGSLASDAAAATTTWAHAAMLSAVAQRRWSGARTALVAQR
jgi:hypothetical protein